MDQLKGGLKLALLPEGIDMAWTIDKALDDPLLSIVQRQDSEGAFLLRIGPLRTVVSIQLRRTRGRRGRTAYTQSHAIKTPLQGNPYWTSLPEDDTPGAALHKAIEGMLSFYRTANGQGFLPEESWLVPQRA